MFLDPHSSDRTQWFRDARFGMFIHWGAYAVAGKDPWMRSIERISIDDYQPFVEGFQPDSFDPDAWADLAVRAGMKYAVLTAKHHDGFCLFDSAETTYSTMHNGLGRDLVAEYVEAFRRRGIKVGLYYSLLDWSHPGYPAFGDEHHPHRDDEAFRGHERDFEAYLDYLHTQVRELCTNYGQLDLMWFDFSYGGMIGEKWRAAELVEMVKGLQPGILLDNRLEASGGSLGSLVTCDPTPWSGDFVSPEQIIPADGIRDVHGRPVPWESCCTTNNHWGWFDGDEAWKSSRTIVRKLVECVSKGGNLLLNVGPQPDGRIPEAAADVLVEVGAWLERNGQSIYGAGIASVPKPEWGYYTQTVDELHAHVFEQPIGPLALTGVDKDRIGEMRLQDRAVERTEFWIVEAYPDVAFVSFGDDDPSFTYPLPDDTDTVVSIRLLPALAANAADASREAEPELEALTSAVPA
jgi:alpha-L-fucosidase